MIFSHFPSLCHTKALCCRPSLSKLDIGFLSGLITFTTTAFLPANLPPRTRTTLPDFINLPMAERKLNVIISQSTWTAGPGCSKQRKLNELVLKEVNLLSVLWFYYQIFRYVLLEKKRWEGFSHFLIKKLWCISDISVWNFNKTLSNGVVSFEQPDTDCYDHLYKWYFSKKIPVVRFVILEKD